jgi:hypothetical protein
MAGRGPRPPKDWGDEDTAGSGRPARAGSAGAGPADDGHLGRPASEH